MRRRVPLSLALSLVFGLAAACTPATGTGASPGAGPAPGPAPASAGTTVPRVAISYAAAAAGGPVDGRLLLLFGRSGEAEPRFQVSDGPETGYVFGVDVDGWRAGEPATIPAESDVGRGGSAFGYPVASLKDLPPGRYRVQAVLNRYQTFHLADGRVLKLPPERGEGQRWNAKPGNLFSEPVSVEWSPDAAGVHIAMDRVIPEIEPPADTKWVKHVRVRSERLSAFWGTDVYLGANVLLPAGFDSEPERRYPVAIFHGHFPYDFGDWRTSPPDPDAGCVYSARFDWPCYNRTADSAAYALFQEWTSDAFPRMLVVEVQHANPYYDDSYAVNSANLGPYGDAITYELIPEIERRFRGIGQGWSRFLYGGSTGGWEAMAVQVFYPDDYNGAWIACPDPIDFRAYTVVNLYDDSNAYHLDDDPNRTPRPGHRDWLGHVQSTLGEMNHRELALGTRGRSGDQWDIWQAVYSPAGADGYPAPIWNKLTGEIDHDVAAYWRDHYDLVHILRRDWATLGPKLAGKLHIYVGDMDNYYLNDAVYLAEDFLESTTDPYYAGEVAYGDRAEHCWNGDPTRPNALSRLRYIQMFAPRIMERIRASGH